MKVWTFKNRINVTEATLCIQNLLLVGETGHAFCNCDLHSV